MPTKPHALLLGGPMHGQTWRLDAPLERIEVPLSEPRRLEYKNQSFGGAAPRRRAATVYRRLHVEGLEVLVYAAEGYEPCEEDEELLRASLMNAARR